MDKSRESHLQALQYPALPAARRYLDGAHIHMTRHKAGSSYALSPLKTPVSLERHVMKLHRTPTLSNRSNHIQHPLHMMCKCLSLPQASGSGDASALTMP